MGGATSLLKFDSAVDAQLKKVDWSKSAPSREPIIAASSTNQKKDSASSGEANTATSTTAACTSSNRTQSITLVQQSMRSGRRRDFDIYDDVSDQIIFRTTPMPEAILRFGLVDRRNARQSCYDADPEPILTVHTNPSHRQWTICASSPTYAGQEKFPLHGREENMKDSPHRYKRAIVEASHDRFTATIRLFGAFDPKNESSGSEAMRAEYKSGEIKTKDPPLLVVKKLFGPRGHWTAQIDDVIVGYWTWETGGIPLVGEVMGKKNRLKMKLAPGADVALHVIAALVMNMIHVDQTVGAN